MNITFILSSQVSSVQQRCSSSALYLDGFLGSNEKCDESEVISDHCVAGDNRLIALDRHSFLHNVV